MFGRVSDAPPSDKKTLQMYSIKTGVTKNLAKFTGKHLCWSHFFK